MKLFDTHQRIGMFCDTYRPITEKRRGDEVLDLTLRVASLTAELASTLPGETKRSLFRIDDGEPLTTLNRVQFENLCPDRQTLNVYAAPDIKVARVCLAHVLVKKVVAKRGDAGWSLILHAVTDGLDLAELECIYGWRTHEQFVTFHESEPLLDVEDDGAPAETMTITVTGSVVAPTEYDDQLTVPTPNAVEHGHRYPEKKKRGRSRKVKD